MSLQYIPPRQPYAGEAFKSGVGAYADQSNKNRTFGLQEQQLAQQKSQFGMSQGLEREKMDQREDESFLKYITDMVDKAPAAKAKEFLEDPEVIAKFEERGWPMPVRGSTTSKGDSALVDTWIATKSMSVYGIPTKQDKNRLDMAIALKLKDHNWRENFPEKAKAFDKSYPSAPKEEPKEPRTPTRRDKYFTMHPKPLNYRSMTEDELNAKAREGDQAAIAEAMRKGYIGPLHARINAARGRGQIGITGASKYGGR